MTRKNVVEKKYVDNAPHPGIGVYEKSAHSFMPYNQACIMMAFCQVFWFHSTMMFMESTHEYNLIKPEI